jgi:hypothetical protein
MLGLNLVKRRIRLFFKEARLTIRTNTITAAAAKTLAVTTTMQNTIAT